MPGAFSRLDDGPSPAERRRGLALLAPAPAAPPPALVGRDERFCPADLVAVRPDGGGGHLLLPAALPGLVLRHFHRGAQTPAVRFNGPYDPAHPLLVLPGACGAAFVAEIAYQLVQCVPHAGSSQDTPAQPQRFVV